MQKYDAKWPQRKQRYKAADAENFHIEQILQVKYYTDISYLPIRTDKKTGTLRQK